MPEMTEKQAIEVLKSLLHSAIAAMPATPSLRPLRRDTQPCTDPITDEDGSSVTVSRGYWLIGLDPQRTTDYVQALRSHWSASGFRITADTRPRDRWVVVEQRDGGYRMSVIVSDTGVLSISASSPCVAMDDADGHDDGAEP